VKKPEPYVIIVVLFSLLAVINLLAAVRLYQQISQPITIFAGTNKHSAPLKPETVANDIKTLLLQDELRRSSYQLIADKNLFSAQRVAWKPPVVDKEKNEEVVSQARRSDVVLYGTFTVGNKMGALLEFTSFKKGQRKKTLFSGDQVSTANGASRKEKKYTLLKVKPSSVTVRDYNGIVFNVGLYDDKKHQQEVVKAKTSISVTSNKSGENSSVVAGSSRSVEAAKVVKARTSAVATKKKMESGELREIKTPFGSAFIKKKKRPKKNN